MLSKAAHLLGPGALDEVRVDHLVPALLALDVAAVGKAERHRRPVLGAVQLDAPLEPVVLVLAPAAPVQRFAGTAARRPTRRGGRRRRGRGTRVRGSGTPVSAPNRLVVARRRRAAAAAARGVVVVVVVVVRAARFQLHPAGRKRTTREGSVGTR